MYTDVYVGCIKSEYFDYDSEGNAVPFPSRAIPVTDDDHLYEDGEREVFRAIFLHPDRKITNQGEHGCSVIKMTGLEMCKFLLQDDFYNNSFAIHLSERIRECLLPDNFYLLSAVEGMASLILFNVINRNRSKRRWQNLYAVDFFTNWMEGDRAFIWPYYNPYELGYDKRDSFGTPAYWGFFLKPLEDCPYEIEFRNEDHNKWWNIPCIAFEAYDRYGESAPFELKVMEEPYLFNYSGCVLENELTDILESIIPGLTSFRIEQTKACEEKLCRLFDVLEDYALIYNLKSNNIDEYYVELPGFIEKVSLSQLLYDLPIGIHNISKESEWHEEWACYDIQKLCLLYAFFAIDYFVLEEDVCMVLLEIKDIIEKENITLDDYTLWYLNKNRSSLSGKDAQTRIDEIIELCSGISHGNNRIME